MRRQTQIEIDYSFMNRKGVFFRQKRREIGRETQERQEKMGNGKSIGKRKENREEEKE